ncbi:MAG TPA: hypothetical protein VND93_30095 [Myxococcales bacterium]|nr:hypothetical protein [Myxococcales bacterium]
MHEEACPEIGPICLVRDEPPQVHDQSILSGDLRLEAEYGVASGWSLVADASLRVVRSQIQYRDLDGNLVQLDYENIHHRNETLVGTGDPQLALRRGFDLAGVATAFRLGTTLPLGQVQTDPFQAALRGEPHEHIQFGAGTPLVVVGADARKEWHDPVPWSVSGFFLGQLAFLEDRYGYRPGHRFLAGVEASARPFRGLPLIRAGVLGYHETAERWALTPNPSEGNLGRTDLYLGLGLVLPVASDWTLSLGVRVPVLSYSVEAQVAPAPLLELGGSRLFHVHAGGESDVDDD